ncbi:MAG: hypothetical protein DRP29_01080 [Thermodesulfobacteriota bacterium]|nr:MAG: hypothetical protein DRP29_01080 [Thermodesulfobacteriota bacterium]
MEKFWIFKMNYEGLKYFKKLQRIYEDKLKDKLLKDPYIKENLPKLIKAIQKTREAFIKNESFAFCKKCAESGEKCCEAGLEWKLSPAEFFLNLLILDYLNESFDLFNLDRPEDCLFLGENGCLLKLAPLFCRNFFCDKLSNFLGKKRLIEIQHAMEDEAILSFKLSNYLNQKYLFNLK